MSEPDRAASIVEDTHNTDLPAAQMDAPTELSKTARAKFEAVIAELDGYAAAAQTRNHELEQAQLDIDSKQSDLRDAVTAWKVEVEAAKAMIVAERETYAAVAQTRDQEVEQARVQIETKHSEVRTSSEALLRDIETAKGTINEINGMLAAAQNTGKQAGEAAAQAVASLDSISTALANANDAANRVEAIKTSSELTQGIIATMSEHIEGGRVHADKVRGEIDRLFTEAQQSATNAEAQHQASGTALENLNKLYGSAQTVKSNTDSNAETVTKLRQQCEEHAATAKKLADIADTTDKKVSAYEARLAELDHAAADRLKTIDGLLSSAASTGLASAFNRRCSHFKWPQRIWQGVFIVSVLALLGIAGVEFSLFSKADTELTWEQLALSLLHRLPFAAPLIWLAIHASGKAALAQRVEEDYAFKETVSRSFEGYRREMAELEGKAAPESALSRLCSGVLSVITNPPGRIYEKHPLNQTPLNALAESAKSLAEAASKITTPTSKLDK